jgi:hypothetical protein
MIDTMPPAETPEVQVLEHLRSSLALFRRNSPSLPLAKAILAEEERVVKRLEKLAAAMQNPAQEEAA